MSQSFTNSLSQSLLYGIYNDIHTNNNSYYYYIGKSTPWIDDNDVPVTFNNNLYESYTRNNIVFLKKIHINDIAFIIPRYNWEPNTIFTRYDNTNENLSSSMFYCLTSNNNVYKCIDNNNNSPSTVQPYATSNNIISLSDGYKWKYMYTIPISIIESFQTSDYIPVINAVAGEYFSRGSIYSATINNHGENYNKNTLLIVDGNGYQLNNKLKVSAYTTFVSGSGYLIDPIVTVTSPYPYAKTFELNTEYLMGEQVKYNYNVYEVVMGGTSSSTVYPSHTCICSNIVDNGTVALKFIAKEITGNATVNSIGTGVNKYLLNDLELNGFIGDVIITNGGYGYDETYIPSVQISSTGDGIPATGVANITNGRVYSITITNHGTKYTDLQTNVIIAPPFQNATAFSPLMEVVLNQIIEHDNIFYKALNAGTLSSTHPTHETGTVLNGDVLLEMVGEQATAIAETYYGYGYNNAPEVTISNPHLYNFNPIPFALELDVTKDSLIIKDYYVFIANNTGTFSDVDDILLPTSGGFTTTQTNGTVSLTYLQKIIRYQEDTLIDMEIGDITYVMADGEETRFYEITGVLGSYQVPTHNTGTVAGLLYIPIILPNVQISTEQTKAKFFPVVENGQIVAAICSDPGVGYTHATITAYQSYYGVGTSVDIIPNISKNSTTTKQEYTELSAIPGTIDVINIINPGTQYNIAPEVIITGDGTGCTAIATLTYGSISNIEVLTPGQNYSHAVISFKRDVSDDLNGAINAEAYPIISPVNGHGHNAISELYAKTLALTMNIGEERINGTILPNSYRQFGIIRNPLQFSKKLRYNNILGSCCYTIICNVYGNIDNSLPLYDINNNEYTILYSNISNTVLSQITYILQPTSNSKLKSGDILRQINNQTTIELKVLTIKNPEINKHSGDLLTIDNREPFAANVDQSILLKTIINT